MTYREIASIIKCSRVTICNYARRNGISRMDQQKEVKDFDWDQVRNFYSQKGVSATALRKKFRISERVFSQAKEQGLVHLKNPTRGNEDVFIRYDPRKLSWKRARNIFCTVRNRIIRGKLLPEICSHCGIEQWRGKPISLHLDHINGDPYDNRRENLRFLCPNCHSQTETFAGKNKKNYKAVLAQSGLRAASS